MSSKNPVDLKDVAPDNEKNLPPTSTDMYVDIPANKGKWVPENQQWFYKKGEPHSKSDDPDDKRVVDDDMNSYKKNDVFDKNEHKSDEKRPDSYTRSDTRNDRTRTEDDEDSRLKKLDMLRKLGELQEYGATLSQNYSLKSDLKTMEYEYDLQSSIRSKQQSVKWMSHMMIGIVNGLELLNDNMNPFDIKLKGLSNKIGSDINSYYDVLGEIYEKYNKPGKKMAPELRLVLMIAGVGIKLNMSRIVPKLMAGESENLKSDANILNDLRAKASKASNKHRKKVDPRKKKLDDMTMMKNKDMEFQKIRNEDVGSLHRRLVLSDSTMAPSRNKTSIEGMTADDQMAVAENLALRQKIQELEREENVKRHVQTEKLERKKLAVAKRKLEEIYREIADSDTEASSVSTISVNPKGLEGIFGKKKSKKSKKKKKGKKKSKSKKSKKSIHEYDDDLDGLSVHDLSVGSSGKKKKKKGRKSTVISLDRV